MAIQTSKPSLRVTQFVGLLHFGTNDSQGFPAYSRVHLIGFPIKAPNLKSGALSFELLGHMLNCWLNSNEQKRTRQLLFRFLAQWWIRPFSIAAIKLSRSGKISSDVNFMAQLWI